MWRPVSPVLKRRRWGDYWGLLASLPRQIAALQHQREKVSGRAIEEDNQCELLASILRQTGMYICTQGCAHKNKHKSQSSPSSSSPFRPELAEDTEGILLYLLVVRGQNNQETGYHHTKRCPKFLGLSTGERKGNSSVPFLVTVAVLNQVPPNQEL